MTLINYFPDFLLLLRDVQGQSQSVAQREADAKTLQLQIGRALDSLRYVRSSCSACVLLLLPAAQSYLTLMKVGFSDRWGGLTASTSVIATRHSTLAFGELRETHSEPQTDFSTCCGACGLKARAVNRPTQILALACNAPSPAHPSSVPLLQSNA
jgi:hypothetical protein